jgi:hypothetical protein
MGPRRRKAKRDRPSEDASHQNAGPNDSEDQHLPNEGRSDELPPQQDPKLRRLTVMFCEHDLQKTVYVNASATIPQAKAIGSYELMEYLRPNAPPGLTFDDQCTDFFPGMI